MNKHVEELLAAYREALVAGDGSADPVTDARELEERLRRISDCVKALEEPEERWVLPGGARPGQVPRLLAAVSGTREGSPPDRLGPFWIERELGRGGFGVVLLARRDAGPRIALKVPRPEILMTPQACRRFLHEAQAAAGLKH